MMTSIIPMGIDNKDFSIETCDIACNLIPWLYSIGFVISFSALFSKTWRVNKILNNPDKFRKVKVTPRDVIAPFIILMSINLIVLVVWTVVEPLKWEIKTKGDVDLLQLKEQETYGICVGESLENTLLFAGIIAAVDISSLVFANIQAYQCRNISVEYSESQWIAIAMVSIMQVLFIGIPLMVLVIDEPEPQFFVRVGIVFVTSMSTLLLIFLPKVKYNRDLNREKADKERARRQRNQESVNNSDYMSYVNSGTSSSVLLSTASAAEDIDGGTRSSSYEGVKIINHPGEEDPQVKRIKIQIQHAEEEHQALLKELDKLQTQRNNNQHDAAGAGSRAGVLLDDDEEDEVSEIQSGIIVNEGNNR